MRSVALFLITATLASNLVAQPRAAAGIVYGADHAYALEPPRGWVLDNQSGRAQGLQAVFYREGSSWAEANVVMYTNAASKKTEGQETIEKLIAYDVAQFEKKSKTLKVRVLEPIELGRAKALVREFTGDQFNNTEAVAYIDAPAIVVMFVLSSRDEEGYRKAFPAFVDLVKSYRWVSSDVRIKP